MDIVRAMLVLIVSVGQLAASFLLFPRDFEALTVDGPVPAVADLAQPAGYAFLIWLVIYALGIVFAIFQLLPGQWRDPILRRTSWWIIGAFGAAVLFLIVARFGQAWMMIPVILMQFAGSVGALYLALNSGPVTRGQKVFMLPMLGLLAGWLSAAVVLTFTNILPEYGIAPLGLSGIPLAFFTIVVVSAIALLLLIVAFRGYWAYVGTVGWALIGVIVANFADASRLPVAIAAGLALVVLVGVTIWRRRGSIA